MNVVGIITEHNPFHNGHLYHVNKARETCHADYVVSVMSGHFLQRGEPALFNKWARAKMAVLGGVDLVIELPTAFSVRSARMFSIGSVSLLNLTGVVSHVCFGSESGTIEELQPVANLLANEPPEFKGILADFLGEGMSFPSARAKAITRYFSESQQIEVNPDLYNAPNNILGIEYLRSLITLKSPIKPVTIKRYVAGYHDNEIATDRTIASATSIREELLASRGNLNDMIMKVIPPTTYEIMEHEIILGQGPVFMENYRKILFYLLRTLAPANLRSLCDVTEGLENRILHMSREAENVKALINKIKTKRYTWTRIQRILTYILLGYTSAMANSFDSTGPRYLRILGISAKGSGLLKAIKKRADVPVIIRTSSYLSKQDSIAEMLNFDVRASDIYSLLYPGTSAHHGNDYKIMPYFQV